MAKEDKKQLVIDCIFQGARTTIDGGWRFTFDTSESNGIAISRLAQLKNQALFVAIIAKEDQNSDGED